MAERSDVEFENGRPLEPDAGNAAEGMSAMRFSAHGFIFLTTNEHESTRR
jgi:hypothetical protein